MIKFYKQQNLLIMRYQPEQNADWLEEGLKSEKEIPFSRSAFNLRQEIYLKEIHDKDKLIDEYYRFVVGELKGEYYKMDRRFLGIEYNLYLHESISFERKTFVAERNIPIFKFLNDFDLEELWIGGEKEEALPKVVFEEMLKQFPTTWELNRYSRARVSSIIRNYVPIETDFEEKYRKYRERKTSKVGIQPLKFFAAYESDKFKDLLEKLEAMLSKAEEYNEKQWQKEILQIIQLLYPKYIHPIPEAPVHDSLAKKNRSIDFLLVDASGYVDAVEIKKPFAKCIVTSNRYRDNHVPMRELSGTVMQLEKYLYHLNRWGQQGEKKLNERYGNELPKGLKIRLINPNGMIIMGRDKDLTQEQRNDFEVIRRKYRHVLEIMTYDDMLRRLKVIRDQLESSKNGHD